ncbi:hypothetical protein HMPREF0201_04068 [Cedecea davisae DSM 4568]|uniref:Uncharacterized protein n=1 Tax=Cedecea davisae DSM 4568 TaxID=566551 RepID=S3IL86_9ENTR|nr:hypothetical protein HMPREF0201_04068 [Cedecea davisae DSM 4568]
MVAIFPHAYIIRDNVLSVIQLHKLARLLKHPIINKIIHATFK